MRADREVQRVTREERLRLAETAVRGGTLPTDPGVPFSSIYAGDSACSLCGERLGHVPAFRLVTPGRVLLDAECFSTWIDVVVTPSRDRG